MLAEEHEPTNEQEPEAQLDNSNPETEEEKEQQALPETGPDSDKLDFDKIYEKSFRNLDEGSIVKGTVISANAKEVVVDIGYKSEAILPASEFKDPTAIKPGDEVEVLLEDKENDEGMVIASKTKADLIKNWESIINNYQEGDVIEGTVTRKVKGGLMVDIGIQAFLPASLAGVRSPKEIGNILGQTKKFKIVKINRPRKNIVNRPTSLGGRGYHICGDHRQTIPALYHLLVSG